MTLIYGHFIDTFKYLLLIYPSFAILNRYSIVLNRKRELYQLVALNFRYESLVQCVSSISRVVE